MKFKVLLPVILKHGLIANTGDVVDSSEILVPQGFNQSYVDHLTALKRIEPVADAMVDKMADAAPVDKLGKGKR